MELHRAACLAALGLGESDVPRLALVASTWGRPDRADGTHLDRLGAHHELGLAGMRLLRAAGGPVLYCASYGSARASEPVHVSAALGTPVAVLVGACVALQPGVRAGDVVIAGTATIGEGASQYYGGQGTATADPGYADAAAAALAGRGVTVHRGRVVTSGALLGPEPRLVESWAGAGHLALDLETSAVLSVAATHGMRAVALLTVVSGPLDEASWLDTARPVRDPQVAAAGELLVDVALEIGLGPAPA